MELEIDRSNLKELKYPERSMTDRLYYVEFQNLNKELFSNYEIKFDGEDEDDGDYIWIYIDWYSPLYGFSIIVEKCFRFSDLSEFFEFLNYLFGTYDRYFRVR
jgi:hypothetical protein